MQVILLERVAKLGQMGEVVTVKDGFARNFLLPQGKALRANENNIKSFEAKKLQLQAQNLETKTEAEAVGAKLDGQIFTVIRSASDAGALYGSVTTRDAAEAATEAGFTVGRGQVVLDRPIKELGMHTVSVTLHPEVIVKVKLNVASSWIDLPAACSAASSTERATFSLTFAITSGCRVTETVFMPSSMIGRSRTT